MLSIIIQEHNEPVEFITKMLQQVSKLPFRKEVIIGTSMNTTDFTKKFSPATYDYRVVILGDLKSCGAARNAGGLAATGNELFFLDAHVCFTPKAMLQVLDTLDRNPNAIVAPALQPTEFPSCEQSGGIAYGVHYKFDKEPFQWTWFPATRQDKEFPVPFVCGCMFSIKKPIFNKLIAHGGFLSTHRGLSWEEEKCMRLWRLGIPSLTEPRAVFGHYFKGYPGHTNKGPFDIIDWHKSFAVGAYINIFDPVVWEYVNRISEDKWGDDWKSAMVYAKKNFSWLRAMMMSYHTKIDEGWFLLKP